MARNGGNELRMITKLQISGRTISFDPANPIDISIPLDFYGPQPNAYGVEPASAKACDAGEMIGDTRRGGSCNFEQVTLIPHCNGTHTECVGHITHERISVRDSLQDTFMTARVVSIKPEGTLDTNESYSMPFEESDHVITFSALKAAINGNESNALIVRTLPNDVAKKSRSYGNEIPPFFTTEAMEFIVGAGISHLLVDIPSIDRLFDEGRLSNHRKFWKVEPGSFEIADRSRLNATVTELIYVPESVPDGEYLLNLQIAPFSSDAAPSRPMIFAIAESEQ